MDVINKGSFGVLLQTILKFDTIFALSAVYVDWDPIHLSLLVFLYYTYW